MFIESNSFEVCEEAPDMHDNVFHFSPYAPFLLRLNTAIYNAEHIVKRTLARCAHGACLLYTSDAADE